MKKLAQELAGCRVLIVEDDGLITMLLEELLATMGCSIVGVASRFDDAMDKCVTCEYDVVLLDVNLHGERTFPIAEALLARGKPFVIATGYNATVLPESLRAAPLLQKPYRRQQLATELRDAMDAARA